MKRWTNGLPGATKRLGANLALRGLSVSQSGCARIPMMARSKIAPLQRPNTLMQLSRSSVLELRLATHGRAIHIGTTRPCRQSPNMSGVEGRPAVPSRDGMPIAPDFPQKLMDLLPYKAISSVPKLANRTPFAFVIDSFLVRAADYSVGHRDR